MAVINTAVSPIWKKKNTSRIKGWKAAGESGRGVSVHQRPRASCWASLAGRCWTSFMCEDDLTVTFFERSLSHAKTDPFFFLFSASQRARRPALMLRYRQRRTGKVSAWYFPLGSGGEHFWVPRMRRQRESAASFWINPVYFNAQSPTVTLQLGPFTAPALHFVGFFFVLHSSQL